MLRRAAIAGELRSWVEAFAIGEAEPAEIDTAGLTASPEETPARHRGSAVPAV